MNNREVAYKHFMQEEMRIGKSYQDIFNAGYQAALASQAQQTESQWISVEERLPEENCHVLVACGGGNVATTFYATDHSFFNHAHGYKLSRKVHGKYSKHFELARQYRYKITHWMPLPPAPEGDKPCA